MGELEERISSVLNDPEQLSQIRAMAQALMGGANAGVPFESGNPAPPGNAGSSGNAAPPENPASLEKLAELLRGGAAGGSPRLAALEALASCLDEKRREKLRRAMRLARVLRLAQAGLLSAEGKDV